MTTLDEPENAHVFQAILDGIPAPIPERGRSGARPGGHHRRPASPSACGSVTPWPGSEVTSSPASSATSATSRPRPRWPSGSSTPAGRPFQRLPIDLLKIDRSFVKDMDARPSTLPLVHAIIELAHSLGLQVIAEGVETPEQLDALQRLACDQVQGFFLGEPVSAEEAAARWLQESSAAPG